MIKFSEWLLEAKLDRNFNIDVAGELYKVIRTVHVTTARTGDNKPRDYKMSNKRYQEILSKVIEKIPDDKVTTITWTEKDKNNVLVLVLKDNEFRIISVINNTNTSKDKLFNKSPNIIHL